MMEVWVVIWKAPPAGISPKYDDGRTWKEEYVELEFAVKDSRYTRRLSKMLKNPKNYPNVRITRELRVDGVPYFAGTPSYSTHISR